MKQRLLTTGSILILAALLVLIICAVAKGIAEPALVPAAGEAAAEPRRVTYTVDLTQFIIAVIGIIMSYLMAWMAKKIVPPVRAWLQAHTTHEQRETLARLTTEAVKAAEQLIGAGRGAEKLDYVIKSIEAHGFTADRTTIEAAVKDMNDFHLTDLFADPAPAAAPAAPVDPAGEAAAEPTAAVSAGEAAAEPIYREDESAGEGLLCE